MPTKKRQQTEKKQKVEKKQKTQHSSKKPLSSSSSSSASASNDYQDDFAIQIETYPVLTKGSYNPKWNLEDKEIFSEWKDQMDMMVVFYKPSFEIFRNSSGDLQFDYFLEEPNWHFDKGLDLEFFEEHYSDMMLRSGILKTIKELPEGMMIKARSNFGEGKIGERDYHQDGCFFHMLQYFNTEKDYAVSTEFIFLSDAQIENPAHPALNRVGKPLVDIYQKLEEDVYPSLDPHKYKPTIIRSKLRNGDFLIWNDIIMKHSTIDETPLDGTEALNVHVRCNGTIPDKTVTTQICKSFAQVTDDDLDHRGFYGFDMHLEKRSTKKATPPTGSFIISGEQVDRQREVKSICNFSIDEFKTFLKTLTDQKDTCTTITVSGPKLKIRGGKKTRKQRNKKK
jgi:hypothetical protein